MPSTKTWLAIPSSLALAVFVLAAVQSYEKNGTGTVREIAEKAPVTDWKQYGNTDGGTRFAEIEQINTETVGQLKEVWRYRTGVDDDFKMTPLQVDNKLFICGAKNILMAVNSDSGEEPLAI